MPALRVQVVIPATSSVPTDACVNNWGFQVAATGVATFQAISTALKTFYDSWANFRGAGMAWTQARAKIYNLSDPKPRVPLSDNLLGLSSAVASNMLPREVACCLSFQIERVSGANMRRGRGRVYLGPFGLLANNSSTGRVDNTFYNAVRTGAQALLDASGTDPLYAWAVVSEATGESTALPVHDGWVDDAFDTQRRRGPAALTRVVFTQAA